MGIKHFDVMNLSKTGLINSEQLGYKDSIEIIKDESLKVQKSFVKIGWYLKHIRDNGLYKEDGYDSVWECAADQLGYSQSTASRFINICEKFSKDHNSPELDAKYAGFDKSQMIEMLPMEAEQLEKVTPDMTVKQIRDIKSENKINVSKDEPIQTADDNVPGQTSIEKDFPKYLPDEQPQDEEISYATSHKEDNVFPSILESDDTCSEENDVIDGEYREISETEPKEGTHDKNWFTSQFINLDTAYHKQGSNEPDPCCKNCGNEVCGYRCSKASKLEPEPQPELPVLKNNDQRKEWLADYKAWGLWYRDEHIDVNYYKYDFSDGSRLVVAEYPQRYEYWNDKRSDEYYYHLLEKNKKSYKKTYDEQYRNRIDSETNLVEFLKNLQKRG